LSLLDALPICSETPGSLPAQDQACYRFPIVLSIPAQVEPGLHPDSIPDIPQTSIIYHDIFVAYNPTIILSPQNRDFIWYIHTTTRIIAIRTIGSILIQRGPNDQSGIPRAGP